MSAKDADLSAAEILAAEKLLDRAMAERGMPNYSPEERCTLAILVAYAKMRGKMSKGPAKLQAEYRRNHVNVILRYVIDKNDRQSVETATSLKTVMTIVDWLDGIGIEASETQVRRDIKHALSRGPLSA